MNNTEKLIAELREWDEKHCDGELCFDSRDKFDEILSRHTPKPKDEGGLREYLIHEIYLLKNGHVHIGPFQDGMIYAYENILDRHPAPTDRQESLEGLAKRKGLRLEMSGWLHRPDNSVVVCGAESEAAIRGYLEALPDSEKRGRV